MQVDERTSCKHGQDVATPCHIVLLPYPVILPPPATTAVAICRRISISPPPPLAPASHITSYHITSHRTHDLEHIHQPPSTLTAALQCNAMQWALHTSCSLPLRLVSSHPRGIIAMNLLTFPCRPTCTQSGHRNVTLAGYTWLYKQLLVKESMAGRKRCSLLLLSAIVIYILTIHPPPAACHLLHVVSIHQSCNSGMDEHAR